MENNQMLKTNIQTDFSVQHNISTNMVMKDYHFHDVFEIYCTLSERIRPIIQYIHNNISGNLSLDSLVERFFISKHHMGYLFKKATGFSVNEYIVNCRIIKARELLGNGLTVTEAGEKQAFSTFGLVTGKLTVHQ
jgi:AraC-type DNA-binding domain-containing proteins